VRRGVDVSFQAARRDVPPTVVAREHLLAQVAFEATWEREFATDRVSWSGSFASMFGYAPDDMVGSVAWWKERVHPDDLDRVERTFEQALSSGAFACSNEYRFRRKDGSWAWVAGRVAIERDPLGRPVRAIVQEALTNVIRHSGAKHVAIELHGRAGAVRVGVRDDGKGFDASRAAAAGEGHGLLNMQERTELAGGGLEIASAPGRGTTIRATFPVFQGGDR
jgi:PAS domain S-box-containing protein